MAASSEFSGDFTQYLADTARELAETGRRTERAIEEMRVIAAAIQQDSRLASEALLTVASGLRDFSETAFGATDRATAALIEFCEKSKDDMRRLAELSDMLAAYLSVPGDEDAAPGQEESE